MHRIASVAIVLVLLAGCSDDPAPKDPTLGEQGFQDIETGPDTGAISGVVVDQAIVPIADATVTISGFEFQTTTDEAGQFVFESLDPGTYFIQVEAARYNTTQSSAQVTAGDVTTTRIQLVKAAGKDPYHVTFPFKGQSGPWAGFASFVVEVVAPGTAGCQCATEITPDPGDVMFTYEATGGHDIDYSTSPVYGNLYWEFIGDPLGSNQDIRSSHGSFDIYRTFESSSFHEDTATWLARITPGNYPHVEFSYEMFNTVWYHEPAPEGWSFLAGDT